MLASDVPLVTVEALATVGFLILVVLAFILYINRRSYKVILLLCSQLSCTVPKPLAKKDKTVKFLKAVSEQASVDLLVTGLLLFTLFRIVTQCVRVGSFASRKSVDDQQRYIELIASSLYILGFAFYNVLFVFLAWVWLKVALVLFSETQKRRVSWAIGIILSVCILLIVGAVGATAIMSLFPDFKFGTGKNVFFALVGVFTGIFFIGQILLTLVIIVLAIKIALLMRAPAADSSIGNKEEDKKLKLVIKKVSIGLIFFVIALIIRAIGVAVILVRDLVPAWVQTIVFMAIPEFTGCIAVVFVLWPYACNCCRKADKKETGRESKTSTEVELMAKTPYSLSATPATPEASSSPQLEAVLIADSPVENSQAVEDITPTPLEQPQLQAEVAAN